MAVKIIIKRRITKGKEAQVLPLLLDLRSKAISEPGYISGETLKNVNYPENYVVISTWKSVNDWEAWKASSGRMEIQERIDALLGKTTEFGIYFYG
jgi:heme oxygenase (mycobilin-producing)